jgi:hypothetical protein
MLAVILPMFMVSLIKFIYYNVFYYYLCLDDIQLKFPWYLRMHVLMGTSPVAS